MKYIENEQDSPLNLDAIAFYFKQSIGHYEILQFFALYKKVVVAVLNLSVKCALIEFSNNIKNRDSGVFRSL